jgi:hypothetical protein
MAWEVSFTCDVCGATKGEANHWWMLSLAECACDDVDQMPQRFSVMPWSVDQSRNGEMRHLCGKGCAMQALERFMTPNTSAAPGIDTVEDTQEQETDEFTSPTGLNSRL